MATLLSQINTPMPEGWRVTHLISLDPEWQCNITNDEHVSVGTGEDPEAAIAAAALNALSERYVGRIFSRGLNHQSVRITDLLSALGLPTVRPPTITRRR